MSLRALVIGAGPTGLAAARRLATRCESVTVVEAHRRGRLRQAGEHLPPSGVSALRRTGLASVLADARHRASSGVTSVWGDASATDRDYFFSMPAVGLTLDRPVFDAALSAEAEAAGATLLYDASVLSLEREPSGYAAVVAAAAGGRTVLKADIVVDASGRKATGARRLGATRRRFDGLLGLVGAITGVGADNDPGRLHIEATGDGWWYAVHLRNGVLLATYMTDAACVRAHTGGAAALWRDRLAACHRIGALALGGTTPDKLMCFDAATQVVSAIEAPGFLAAGDAGAAYDPLSSWGIAKGVLDGDAAAGALLRELDGDAAALRDHRAEVRSAFFRYLAARRDIYALEGRWPTSPFWRARRAGAHHPRAATVWSGAPI